MNFIVSGGGYLEGRDLDIPMIILSNIMDIYGYGIWDLCSLFEEKHGICVEIPYSLVYFIKYL
jgi:hypothetical protein